MIIYPYEKFCVPVTGALMILNDLFQDYRALVPKISRIVRELYPDNAEYYYVEYVFDACLNKILRKSDKKNVEIMIDEVFSDGKIWFDVYGLCKDTGTKWALEFDDWEEWLAYPISAVTAEHYSDEEILAHCIEEMTFIGLEEDIKEMWDKLKSARENIDKQFKKSCD
jgi:hypothetical protein